MLKDSIGDTIAFNKRTLVLGTRVIVTPIGSGQGETRKGEARKEKSSSEQHCVRQASREGKVDSLDPFSTPEKQDNI